MNTEQLIQELATRGLSRRAATQALGLGHWKFDLITGAMGPTERAKNDTTLDNRLAYEASRDRFTPAQAAVLERAHKRWSGSRRSAIGGVTGTIAELVEYSQSSVHAMTVRRHVTADMSLRDTLITPRQQPKPGRRDPWEHSHQQVAPHLDEQIPKLIKDLDSLILCR